MMRPTLISVVTSRSCNYKYILGYVVFDIPEEATTLKVNDTINIMNVVVKHLGFKNIRDYTNAFAIKVLKNSDWGKYYTETSETKRKYKDNVKFMCTEAIRLYGRRLISNSFSNKTATEDSLYQIKNYSKQTSFMLPVSTKDIIKVFDPKFIDKEDLWFCTDWKEP